MANARHKKWRTNGAISTSGAALVEISIIAPLLVLLTMGALQAGLALNQYLRVLDAVHAGVRIGQKQVELPPGTITTSLVRDQAGCRVGLSNSNDEFSLHMPIHRRINKVLCLEDTPLRDVRIVSERYTLGGGQSIVHVLISGIAQTWIPGIDEFPVVVEASGPYLNKSG